MGQWQCPVTTRWLLFKSAGDIDDDETVFYANRIPPGKDVKCPIVGEWVSSDPFSLQSIKQVGSPVSSCRRLMRWPISFPWCSFGSFRVNIPECPSVAFDSIDQLAFPFHICMSSCPETGIVHLFRGSLTYPFLLPEGDFVSSVKKQINGWGQMFNISLSVSCSWGMYMYVFCYIYQSK